jgi:hypothetical protein
MNERVQQLAEQALNEYSATYHNEAKIPEAYLEKFAELIVQDCAEIADTERSNSVGCGYITKTNGMRIKEHFGIEQ